MDGGFYKYDLDDNLSVIGLNTMYFYIKNHVYTDENNDIKLDRGNVQMKWLEKVLSEADSDTKFIFTMHVFPGLNYHSISIEK